MFVRTKLGILLLMSFFLSGIAAETNLARQIFVDSEATGENDGSSWTNAYKNLQDALDSASKNNEILVARGTYTPDQGKGIIPGDRGATFQLRDGISIKGGYAGSFELDGSIRNIKDFKTVLSGDLNGDDEPNSTNTSDNSFNVVTSMGTELTALLDGFTIAGGNARSNGGGIHNHRGSPTLVSCTFTGNFANGNGGGMYNDQGNPTLVDCKFHKNKAGEAGGGIYNSTSSPKLVNCTFSENSALNGGGIYCKYESSPTLNRCTFIRNSARYSGGMANYMDSNPVLTKCTFSENSAKYGGGIRNYNSNPKLTSCTFSENSATGDGGGINNNGSKPILISCMFIRNSTGGYGGGIRNYKSSSIIACCSFISNSAEQLGGGISNHESSNAELTNCILWLNNDSRGEAESSQIETSDSTVTVHYCCIQGLTGSLGGSGNINKDPQFKDPANDNYHLPPVSPCVNTGDTSYAAENGEKDIDGEPRLVNGRVDIGADEYNNQRLVPSIYDTVQSAIDAASAGDEVVISPGAYTGPGNWNIDFKGKTITVRSTDPKKRYVVVSTIINCENKSRGFYFHSGEDANSILNGLSIVNGNETNGGGVYCKDSSPTLANCIFSNNTAQHNGGGMCNENSKPTLTSCTFNNNLSHYGGGGIYNSDSSPTIINSSFKDNWARYGGAIHNRQGSSPTVKYSMFSRNTTAERGGGMDTHDSSPTLINCIFGNNSTDGNGGGMANQSSTVTLTNCTFNKNKASDNGAGIYNLYGKAILESCKFKGNSCKSHGGGMFNGSSDPTLTKCRFSGNLSGGDGGGMYNREGSLILTNCIFTGNITNNNGGAMYNNSSPNITNCTFGSNSAKMGGGLYTDSSSFDCTPTLNSCILWGNKDNSDVVNSAQIYGGLPVITYSCLQNTNPDDPNAFPGIGNIYENPCFVKLGYFSTTNDPNLQVLVNDPNASWNEGNYHLLPNSPCIDSGDPNLDYSVEPKPNGDRINMGTYGNTWEATSKNGTAILFENKEDTFIPTEAEEPRPYKNLTQPPKKNLVNTAEHQS